MINAERHYVICRKMAQILFNGITIVISISFLTFNPRENSFNCLDSLTEWSMVVISPNFK